ncbi:hypothetical protein BG015_011077, partial [Linnemannia schmuckeri]
MDNLPMELFLAIARFFDGPTLVTCLRVCRHWHVIFHPLIWRLIQKTTWHNPRFPLYEKKLTDSAKATTPLDNPTLPTALLHVNTLQWCSVYTASDRKQRPRRQHSGIELDTLGRVVGLTSNLVCLHLQSQHKIKKFESLSLFVRDLHRLQSLKELALMLYIDTDTPVAVEELFPVFSRLNKLTITGLWISPERRQEEKVGGAGIGAVDRGAGAGSLETQQSWKIRSLTVATRLLSLARYCPALVFLTASYDFCEKTPTPETSS